MGEKSRNRYNRIIDAEVTEMFSTILDNAQIACPNKETFKILRARILRAGNDCMRELKKKLLDYDIEYVKINEDIINCGNSKNN